MQIYLVGGAVRDALLQQESHEKDWVVVGATPEAMVEKGFLPVGEAFPVFLHPKTKEEYALARTEKKVAKGYKGFTFYAAPEITLEEDLKRRDFTMNAIAQADDGQLVDPYGGQKDIHDRVIRHVSDAFTEDPVRILRAGRFLARFAPLGFTVAPETMACMHTMVEAGEVDALVPERVWQEMVRALAEPMPEAFFELLEKVGAFNTVLAPLAYQPSKALTQVKAQHPEPLMRFAAWVYETAPDVQSGQALCKRLKSPRDYERFATVVMQQLHTYATCDLSNPHSVLNLLEALDAFRQEGLFQRFLALAKTLSNAEPDKNTQLLKALAAAKKVDVAQAIKANPDLPPKEVAAKAHLAGVAQWAEKDKE